MDKIEEKLDKIFKLQALTFRVLNAQSQISQTILIQQNAANGLQDLTKVEANELQKQNETDLESIDKCIDKANNIIRSFI